MGNVLVSLALTAASAIYQHRKQKKLKAKFDEQRDASLGFEFVTSGEPIALPIVYGRNKIGGVRVYHDTNDNLEGGFQTFVDRYFYYYNNSAANGFSITPNLPDENGKKNEYLVVQQSMSIEGLDGLVTVDVNNLPWNDSSFKKGQWIHFHKDGNVPDLAMQANGVPATNRFLNASSLRMIFKLDRENNNYTGVPDVVGYVRGFRVRTITNSGGSYSINPARVYSNNPAYCLLDFLTSDLYGYGLADDEIDLKSFYDAAQLCSRTVQTARNVEGKIFGGQITRDLPLYECNVVLSSSNQLRDNLAAIMETMGEADLIWSEGKYKLKAIYPTNPTEQLNLISSYHFFSDADIVPETVSIVFPSAEDRYNQYVVRYRNEHRDFEEDTVTWPKTGDSVYNTYLAEDGGILYKGETFLSGITDPYHALAMAEQYVRSSRRNFTLEMTLTRNSRGFSLEPGDLFAVNSYNLGLDNEIFRVEEIEVNDDLTIKIKGYRFDYTDLAWNVADNWAYIARPVYDFNLLPVTTGFTLTNTGLISSDGTYVPSIVASWGVVGDAAVTMYELQWKAQGATEWKSVLIAGRTFEVYPTVPGTTYNFRVRSRSPSQVSDWLTADVVVPNDSTIPGLPSNFIITNGIKSIALNWINHPDKDYAATEIYRNTVNNFSTASLIASVRGTSYLDSPLIVGATYHYWLRAVDTSLNRSNFVYGGTGVAQAIGTNDLGPNVVTADKIFVTSLSAISANLGSIIVNEANINTAAVTTLKIGGNSVTQSTVYNMPSAVSTSSTSWSFLTSFNISLGVTAPAAFIIEYQRQLTNAGGGNNSFLDVRINLNGADIWTRFGSGTDLNGTNVQQFWLSPGTNTFSVLYRKQTDGAGATASVSLVKFNVLAIVLLR
jgi:hypothetical protein